MPPSIQAKDSIIVFCHCRHLDGNHKLISWRIVIHGAIDGYSRVVTFLKCVTNNEADTVLSHFLASTVQYRCPLRIRTDHGTENIGVARWMLEHHGLEFRPVITGMSVHNQRIERLWVDVHRYVLGHFRNIFIHMEETNVLDRDDELDLYALHYVYLPRIQAALDEFSSSWNSHPLSTERSLTPLQVWTSGFYQNLSEDQLLVHDLLDVTSVQWDMYGIDEHGPTPELQTRNDVHVPRSMVELDGVELLILQESVQPLHNDNNFGMTIYDTCRELIRHLISQNGRLL